jgi:hypothetical protein
MADMVTEKVLPTLGIREKLGKDMWRCSKG